MLKGLYIGWADGLRKIYGPEERAAIEKLVDIYAPPQTPEMITVNPAILSEADVIISAWGTPVMDAAFLASAPKLRAVFYGAGSIRYFTTDALWNRKVVVTSAYIQNDVPVAEYTQAAIILSLKHIWRLTAHIKNGGAWWDRGLTVPGCYKSTVGLISLGAIARMTLDLLKPFELQRIVYSTSLTEAEAKRLNVERCGLLEVFQRADVVSLHTASLPQTRGMITGEHFAAMKKGATFINTARGAVVREQEMIEVLRQRPDLTAVLDVTDPEPPAPDSPLLTLPNIIVTPHMSGAVDVECHRNGQSVVEEIQRCLNGQPLRCQLTKETSARLA